MLLSFLLKGEDVRLITGGQEVWRDCIVQSLSLDSRTLNPGALFAALSGERANGEDFIAQAEHRGAVAILGRDALHKRARFNPKTVVIESSQPRRTLARMAQCWWPQSPSSLVAVTGTNGKTSVVEFMRQLWSLNGHSSASLGTLGVRIGRDGEIDDGRDEEDYPLLTTADSLSLHAMLASLTKRDISRVAMEVSSHALAQHRVDGISLQAAAFTNFGRDHLDYHHDVESYFQTKLRLFSQVLAPQSWAVIHDDGSDFSQRLLALCRERGHRIWRYGTVGDDLDGRLVDSQPDIQGIRTRIILDHRPYDLHLQLGADFQVLNALAAVGLFIATGGNLEQALQHLPSLQSPAGRMERISHSPSVWIDYAHTPDALAAVLRSARTQIKGKLAVVFGCGGNRDQGKRAQMGMIATNFADRIIVTDDNPRNEDPSAIRHQIIAAIKGLDKVHNIGDRRQAIDYAAKQLAVDDGLVIAGKGHEFYQQVAQCRLPHDDKAVAIQALAVLGKLS